MAIRFASLAAVCVAGMAGGAMAFMSSRLIETTPGTRTAATAVALARAAGDFDRIRGLTPSLSATQSSVRVHTLRQIAAIRREFRQDLERAAANAPAAKRQFDMLQGQGDAIIGEGCASPRQLAKATASPLRDPHLRIAFFSECTGAAARFQQAIDARRDAAIAQLLKTTPARLQAGVPQARRG